jgi:tetratricopeptide (TPR) repeat protein
MALQELLNDSGVQSLLLSLGASACWDFLKGSARWIIKTDKSDFDEAVEETIAHFSKGTIESIEILPEYFRNMFDDHEMQLEIGEFESGIRDISLKKLGKAFVNAGFYYPLHQTEKAEGIISHFLNVLTNKILLDSNRGPTFLFDTMQRIGKQETLHARATADAIRKLQGNIEPKIDELLRSNKDIKNTVEQSFNAILKAVESPTSSGDGMQSPELKLAIKLHNEGRVLLARQLYLEILAKKPNNIELLWKLNSNIGKTYLNSGEDEKCIPYFEQAYHFFPDEEKGKVQLIFAHLIGGKLDDGLILADDILQNNPNSVDAAILAANILVRKKTNDSYKRAKQLFTPKVLENHLSLYTFAWVLRNLGELEEAEIYYRKSLEKERRPECLCELALCILEPIIQKLGHQNPTFNPVEEETQIKLNEVLALFNEGIELFKMREEPLELAHAYLNRSVVYAFLNNYEGCYNDCYDSEKLNLKVDILFRNKGIALAMLDKPGDAVTEFKKAIDLGDESSILYLIRAFMQSEQFSEAKKVVLEHVSYPEISMTEENLEFYLILSEILERELNTDGADEIIKLAKTNFPNDGEVIIRLANLTRGRYGAKKAIEIILNAIPSVTNKKVVVELILADLYFLSAMWGEALEIYTKYARVDVYDLPIQRILICLFNLGKHAACLEKIKKVKVIYSSKKLLRELEARIFFFAEEFNTASNFYKDLAISYKNPSDYVQWGLCEFRIAHHDEAKRILESASKEFNDKPNNLISISAAFNVIGETKKAVELAFRSVSLLPQSPEAALNFFWIFNQHTKLNPGKGHTTDDQLQMYRDIADHFEERFPGVPGLKKVQLPKTDNKMTVEDFTKIFKQVIPGNEYFRQREQLYLSHRLPVSTYSIMMGRDLIETWGGIISSTNYNLWAFNPQSFPRERVNINAKSIVAEPISILTLYNLNLLNLLDSLFEKVIVPQRFLDTVQESITRERLSENEGSTVVVPVGDSFKIHTTSPEDVTKRLANLRKLKEYLTDRVVGFPIVDDSLWRTKLQIYLRDETIQSTEQSIAQGIPLLCDEATLPSILKDDINLHIISTYTVLTNALIKHLLTVSEFNKAIIDLIALNYNYVPVNAGILFQGLEESNFIVTGRSSTAFRSIADPNSDPILDAIVIAEFLGMLFSAQTSDVTKGYWFNYALDCIPKIRHDPAILLKKIISHLDHKLTITILSKDEILRWVKGRIQTWAKLRGISLS